MSYLLAPSRRSFLRTMLAGAAVLRATTAARAPSTRWAFLADTHIPADPAEAYRGFRPHENLKAVVAQVSGAAPDGAIIDGDLARLRGLPGDYENLKRLLAPLAEKTPVCAALGNHDDRRNFLTAFTATSGKRQPIEGKFVSVLEHGPIRFVFLDSLMEPNVTPGFLGKRQRMWLENSLRAGDGKPVLVFVHHTLGDGDNDLLDVEWLFRILVPARQVKALVYGHSHRYHFDTRDGIHLINIPAVGYNFADSEPVGWVEAALTAEGADFKLHATGGNREDDGKVVSVSWRG